MQQVEGPAHRAESFNFKIVAVQPNVVPHDQWPITNAGSPAGQHYSHAFRAMPEPIRKSTCLDRIAGRQLQGLDVVLHCARADQRKGGHGTAASVSFRWIRSALRPRSATPRKVSIVCQLSPRTGTARPPAVTSGASEFTARCTRAGDYGE